MNKFRGTTNMKSVIVFALVLTVAYATHKCCPQPENEGKCECCPDACCCMCTITTIPCTNPPTTTVLIPASTTSQICENFGLDVAIIQDESSSITEANWTVVMDFLGRLVSSDVWLDVGTETRFGFATYNMDIIPEFDLDDPESDSVASLVAAFNSNIKTPGFTNTAAGLEEAIEMLSDPVRGDRNDTLYPDIAIILTDGLANVRRNETAAIANVLKSTASLVFVIAIGIDPNFAELDLIATPPTANNIYEVDDFNELISDLEIVLNDIQKQICVTVFPPVRTTTTPPQPTTCKPETVQNCKCCCPPLPDPCAAKPYGGPADPCCCRFDNGHDDRKRRRRR